MFYDELIRAIVAERLRMGWSQLELDERAGLQTGYMGKVEKQNKALARQTWDWVLGALGLEWQLVRRRKGWNPPPVDMPEAKRGRRVKVAG